MNSNIKNKNFSFSVKKWFTVVFGIFLYAIGYNLFLLKNDIVAGDIEGIATIFQNYIDPPVIIFTLGIILLISAFIFLDKEKAIGSIIGSILFPIFVYLTANIGNYIVLERNDLLLAAIFGGLFSGFGAGLAFKMNCNTGGTDILHQIVSKYAKISLGKAKIMTDGVIIMFGGLVFGWEMVLYSIVCIVIFSMVTDRVMLGVSSTKALYIITEKEDEIKDYLLHKVFHGVTIIEAKGGYTNKQQNIIMCLIPTRKYFFIKEELELIDKDAFLIVTDAYQSHGGR